jgi:hypothetical protein
VSCRDEGDPNRGAANGMATCGGVAQSHDLGVSLAGCLCEALTEHLTRLTANDTADTRVGIAQTDGLFRKLQRIAKTRFIKVGAHSAGTASRADV